MYLLYVLFLFRIHICFTLLYYFCCNTVAGSLIYSHEILGIWCSIPQTANGKDIVRAPGNLSSVPPPIFLGVYDPVSSRFKTHINRRKSREFCNCNSVASKNVQWSTLPSTKHAKVLNKPFPIPCSPKVLRKLLWIRSQCTQNIQTFNHFSDMVSIALPYSIFYTFSCSTFCIWAPSCVRRKGIQHLHSGLTSVVRCTLASLPELVFFRYTNPCLCNTRFLRSTETRRHLHWCSLSFHHWYYCTNNITVPQESSSSVYQFS
jgi:hypothetical protein